MEVDKFKRVTKSVMKQNGVSEEEIKKQHEVFDKFNKGEMSCCRNEIKIGLSTYFLFCPPINFFP